MLYAILFFIWFAVFAMLYLESFWSNTITLVNVIFASLLAMSFYEPLADFIEGLGQWAKTCTYLWDYLCVWVLFCGFFGILRTFTDIASRTRVKFRPPIEIPGRLIMAFFVGIFMVGFIVTTMHMAPLPAAPFMGALGKSPNSGARGFLKFVQMVSIGSLSRSAITGEPVHPDDAAKNVNAFDPYADFVFKYRQRRRDLEQAYPPGETGSLRVNTGK